MAKTVEYYMSLPYTRELVPDAVVGWGIKIKELPGCMSQGGTPEEALRMIEGAMRGWLESEIEAGSPISEPKTEEEFSGKTVLRMPKWLHRRLVEFSEEEGMSLNQCLVAILAAGVEQAGQKKLGARIEQMEGKLENLENRLKGSLRPVVLHFPAKDSLEFFSLTKIALNPYIRNIPSYGIPELN